MADNNDEKKSIDPVDIFAITIGTLCIMMTTWQTAKGWQPAFKSFPLVLAFSIIITGVLVLLTIVMRKAKIEAKFLRALFAFLIYGVVAGSISFTGNFNALFSNYMKDEILRAELQLKKVKLNEIKTEAIRMLQAMPDSIENNTNINAKNLYFEIADGGDNCGNGPKAKEKVKIVEKLLGLSDNNRLVVPSSEDCKENADAVQRQIDDLLKIRLDAIRKKTSPLVEKFNHEVPVHINKLDSILNNDMEREFSNFVNKTTSLYNDIGTSTHSVVPQFKFFVMKDETAEIGKFSYTLKKANEVMEVNPQSVWVIIIASLMFDFLVPLIILLFKKSGESAPFYFESNSLENHLKNEKQD